MIPVNPHTTVEESKEIVGKQVTPMAAVEERAKEDLKEEIRDNVPHVPADSIKVENGLKSINPLSVVKKKTRKRVVPNSSHISTKKRRTEKSNWDTNIFTSKRARNNCIFKRWLPQ